MPYIINNKQTLLYVLTRQKEKRKAPKNRRFFILETFPHFFICFLDSF